MFHLSRLPGEWFTDLVFGPLKSKDVNKIHEQPAFAWWVPYVIKKRATTESLNFLGSYSALCQQEIELYLPTAQDQRYHFWWTTQ